MAIPKKTTELAKRILKNLAPEQPKNGRGKKNGKGGRKKGAGRKGTAPGDGNCKR